MIKRDDFNFSIVNFSNLRINTYLQIRVLHSKNIFDHFFITMIGDQLNIRDYGLWG